MSMIIDYIVDLGLEVVKDRITDATSRAKVEKRLTDYLEQQQKLNYQSSLEEEIDFGGITDYIKTDLIEDVKQRFWGKPEKRKAARQRIIEQSVSYASANTKISATRTMEIVGTAVDILADYYRKKANKDLLFLTGEIEDTVISEHNTTRALILEENTHLESIIRENSEMSIEHAIQEISEGDLHKVESRLGTYMNTISAEHKLFPDYGFRLTTENKMVSFPLTEEARKKYPENFKITASAVRIGSQPIRVMDKTILDKAYRHQLPIYIYVQNARKYLGNVLDPIQSEADKMIGTHAIVAPPSFPPAFPCSISISEDTVVPYLLLRTTEILDDGTVILTNEEQEHFNFHVSISLIPSTHKMIFNISPHNPTNREHLNYCLFLKRVMYGETITVLASKQNEPIIRGTVDRQEIKNLDEEIEFLQKIILLEDYFETSIVIPESISIEDHLLINRLCDLIQGGYHGEANKLDFTFDFTEEIRKIILELENTDYKIIYSGDGAFSIFDQEFTIPVMREIEGVKVDNLSHLQEKAKVLDVGDQIKISYVSGSKHAKCKYIDRIISEEIETRFFLKKSTV